MLEKNKDALSFTNCLETYSLSHTNKLQRVEASLINWVLNQNKVSEPNLSPLP